MLKDIIKGIIVTTLEKNNLENNDKFNIEVSNNPKHGDYATNVAMVLAKLNKKKPLVLAEMIKEELVKEKNFSKVEIAGPGFINITINISLYQDLVYEILKMKEEYGESEHGKGKSVLLEFVSANPTGPLNIVSARAAAYGDTLYRILTKVGYETKREFYVNDAGNQVDILAESLELRLREVRGENIGDFPIEAYHGDYLIEMAKELNATEGSRLLMLPERDRIENLKEYALDVIHEMQVESLAKLDVDFDNWVSEKKLREQGVVEEVLSFLAEAECTYEKDDAIWFSSTKFGDDKDRVLMKADGAITYFVPDLAYHLTKYQRGFDYIIDVLGPDHHGYVPRLMAAIEALKYDKNKLEIIFLQQINLFDEGERVKMSKRLGKIITMDDLITEVGKDVARFFFIDRRTNAHLNFDMDLATKESEENPVYYIQYAHARINSILKKARKDHKIRIGKPSRTALAYLKEDEEITLMKKIIDFPQLLIDVADTREAHRLANYVYELAGMVHKYYGKFKVIDMDDLETSKGRLFFISAVKNVIAIALDLIGVSAPEKMKSKTPAAKKNNKTDSPEKTAVKKDSPKKVKDSLPKEKKSKAKKDEPSKKSKVKAESKAPKKNTENKPEKKKKTSKEVIVESEVIGLKVEKGLKQELEASLDSPKKEKALKKEKAPKKEKVSKKETTSPKPVKKEAKEKVSTKKATPAKTKEKKTADKAGAVTIKPKKAAKKKATTK
ncbi:arginine--tRNA ligase [bacterium]|nr:arginine--tRNA ligase [bacterium]